MNTEKDLGKYVMERETLGTDTDGNTIFRGYEKDKKRKLAIKVVKRSKLSEGDMRKLATEMNSLRKLNHPLILSLYDVKASDDYYYIITESYECNLREFVRKNGKLHKEKSRRFLRQISSGLEEVHRSLNHIPLEITTDNILLSGPLFSQKQEYPSIRISDFRSMKPLNVQNDDNETPLSFPLNYPPELYEGEGIDIKFTKKCNVWSCGLILFEMLSGISPYQSGEKDEENFNFSIEKYIDMDIFDDESLTFLNLLLQKDPGKRLSFDDFVGHQFLQINVPEIDYFFESKVDPEIPIQKINCSFPKIYIPIRFRGDKKTIFEAVINESSDAFSPFMYASDELRSDKQFVVDIVRENANAFKYADSVLRSDRDFVLLMMKEIDSHSSILNPIKFVVSELRNHHGFMREVVKLSGGSIRFTENDKIRNDPTIALEALNGDKDSLKYVGETLKDEKDFVMEAMRIGCRLQYVSERLRDDKEVVLEAIRYRYFFNDNLKYISTRLKNDRELFIEAVKKSSNSLKHASKLIRMDREIVLLAARKYGASLPEEFNDDRELVMEVVKTNPVILSDLSERLKDDRELVKEVLHQNGDAIKYASERLRNERNMILQASKCQNEHNVLDLERRKDLQNDKTVVMNILRVNPRVIKHASEELRNDFDVVQTAIRKSLLSIQFVGDEVIRTSIYLTKLKSYEGHAENVIDELDSLPESEYLENDLVWKEILLEIVKEKSSDFEPFRTSPEMRKLVDKKIEEEVLEVDQLRNAFSKLHFKDFTFVRKLGRGCYGVTYLCKVKEETFEKVKEEEVVLLRGFFVIKLFPDKLSREKKIELVRRDSLYLGYHPNVVSILYHWENETVHTKRLPDYNKFWKLRKRKKMKKSAMIIMKYYRTDLDKYLKKLGSFDGFNTPLECYFMIRQILLGLCHLHNNMIVHRDLHPGNIFIDPQQGRLWIGDFGCALDLRRNPDGFKVSKSNDIMYSLNSSYMHLKKCGDEDMGAPEIVGKDGDDKHQFYDYKKYDQFSFGILVLIIQQLLLYDLGHSKKAGSMIKKMGEMLMKENPKDRMDFDEALKYMDEIVLYIEDKKLE